MGFNIRKFKTNTLGGFILHSVLVAGTLGILCFIYFSFYLPVETGHNRTLVVPNIEGMSLSQLEVFLTEKNLTYKVADSSYSPEQAPLTVTKQFPQAGARVKVGRNISVTVNRVNPPTVPLPNILDGSIVNAEEVLRSNELKLGKIELTPGPFNVVKTMILNGKEVTPRALIPKGSIIDLIVMDGNSPDIEETVQTTESKNE